MSKLKSMTLKDFSSIHLSIVKFSLKFYVILCLFTFNKNIWVLNNTNTKFCCSNVVTMFIFVIYNFFCKNLFIVLYCLSLLLDIKRKIKTKLSFDTMKYNKKDKFTIFTKHPPTQWQITPKETNKFHTKEYIIMTIKQ